jgi:threonine dehydratase
VLHGSDYDDAFDEAQRLAAEENLTFIHGFNDPYVVAGQGTLGIEIHEQDPGVDAVIVPVGGGGLIGGSALALKKLKPQIQVIGVQSERIPAMKAALEKGRVVHLPPAMTIADGIAMRTAGELALKLARRYVDDVVTVSEGEIANAVLLMLEIEKTVAEGAAAAPLAALVAGRVGLKEKKIALIVSGGNIDMTLISRIIEKGLIQDGRLARISVVIPDQPGNLARLTDHLWKEGANILQIDHARGFGQMAIGETEVQVIFETTGAEHIERIHAALRKEGFQVASGEQ